VGPTKPPIQRVARVVSRGGGGVKRPEHEADHPPQSSAEIKNGGAIRLHDRVLN
jgi:hypothetical protein